MRQINLEFFSFQKLRLTEFFEQKQRVFRVYEKKSQSRISDFFFRFFERARRLNDRKHKSLVEKKNNEARWKAAGQ